MKLIKYKNLNNKNKFMIIGALATWGVIFISSGTTMMMINKPEAVKQIKTIDITQKRISLNNSSKITLKEIEIKTGEQLSMNILDYLVDGDLLDSEIINKLELNISDVNTNQAGVYTYTIKKDKTIYNGQITVVDEEKKLIDTLTLKNLSVPINTILSSDLTVYINELLTDEEKLLITLDITKVNTNVVGTYQYKIIYNNRMYTGNVEVYEPNLPVAPPEEEVKPPTPEPTPTPDVEGETDSEEDKTM